MHFILDLLIVLFPWNKVNFMPFSTLVSTLFRIVNLSFLWTFLLLSFLNPLLSVIRFFPFHGLWFRIVDFYLFTFTKGFVKHSSSLCMEPISFPKLLQIVIFIFFLLSRLIKHFFLLLFCTKFIIN